MKVIIEIEVSGLGAELKKAREAANLSLAEAGVLAGMSAANFNRIENEDTKGVPITTLTRAAIAVGFDLSRFLGGWVGNIPGTDLWGDIKGETF